MGITRFNNCFEGSKRNYLNITSISFPFIEISTKKINGFKTNTLKNVTFLNFQKPEVLPFSLQQPILELFHWVLS